MKNLTVNRLALGNIRQRKKQYIMLIIGIILAMIFSSSIPLLLSSTAETYKQEELNQIGKQDVILYYPTFSEEDYKQLKDKSILSEYGFAHHIGYAYPAGNEKDGVLGAEVTWLDNRAKELSYQTFLEGSYPTKEGEIAAEENALSRIGYKKAKVGDTIKLNLRIQNNNDYIGFVEKEYKLTGIARDKKKRLETRSYTETDLADTLIPAFFVAQNTKTEVGGREKLVAYCKYTDYYYEHYDERYDIISSIDENYDFNDTEVNRVSALDAISRFGAGELMIAVIAVLVFASCVAIINAFNTNLKERKRQIGLLRAVGATKRQIINIFGREALIISLIAVPVSMAISYGIVKIAMGVICDEPYMTKSLLVLPITVAINIAVVMLAALVPLFSASRITPMQAIRNIDATRQVKRKKIKSKKEYNPSKLIARRSLAFSKGSRVAVCIFLSVTILVSCVGFSYVSYMKDDVVDIGADYVLAGMNYQENDYINTESGMKGLTESDRQSICAVPEIEATKGVKRLSASIEVEKLNDYFNLLKAENYTWSRNYENMSEDEMKNEWLKMFKDGNIDKDEVKDYNAIKEVLKVKSEIFGAPIITFTDDEINKLNGKLVSGKIDIDKISNGEEIILVAPKEVSYYLSKSGNGAYVERKYDGKKGNASDLVATATGDFKAGDTLDLIIGVVSSDFDDTAEHNKYTLLDKKEKTVKVGAVISPNATDSFWNIGIITNSDGMNSIYSGVNYSDLNIYTSGQLDDEANSEIMEALQVYQDNYGGSLLSNYEYVRLQKKQIYQFMTALMIIIILGFVICASIINNSISARIRENKSVIGTLRAFGADASALTKIYRNEMLSMFSSGAIIGYALFVLIWIALLIAQAYLDKHFEFVFNPWISIAMTVVLFAVCFINLYIKVKSEMKNSIVENIREL
jgi:ABC-type antimicrobial peptide transport system permease subunit